MHIDPELRQFCTARQLEILEAIELHGSGRGAARALGINGKTARDAYAARGGWIADRAAWSITYHKKWGPIGRVMVSPEMFIQD